MARNHAEQFVNQLDPNLRNVLRVLLQSEVRLKQLGQALGVPPAPITESEYRVGLAKTGHPAIVPGQLERDLMTATQEREEIGEMLWWAWQRNLDIAEWPSECPSHPKFIAPTQGLIGTTRDIMREAGWDAVSQHNFFATLLFHIRKERKHSPASQFVKFLQIETEFN